MQDFNQLDEIEQMSVIMQSGHLMAENTADDQRIFLYRVETFFVAATYQSDDQLCGIRCFLEVDQFAPHYRKSLYTVNPAERV